MQTTKLMRKK